MNIKFMLPFAVAIPNLVNFCLVLFVATLLQPSEFAEFSYAWGIAQLVAVLLFEWLRLATIRYSAGIGSNTGLVRNYPLLAIYRYLVPTTVALSAASCLVPVYGDYTASALFYAAGYAAFEGRQAYYRASYKTRRYVFFSFVRATLSFFITLSIAYISGDALQTLLALSTSFFVPMLLSSPSEMKGLFSKLPLDRAGASELFSYGSGLAFSGILSVATLAIVRSAVFNANSSGAAAGLMLAIEISQRVAAGLGMTLNLLLFPKAVQAVAQGEQRLRWVVSQQIALVFAAIVPSCVGLLSIQSALVWLFPHVAFPHALTLSFSVAAIFIISLRNFTTDVVFAIRGAVRPVCYGPSVGIIILICIVCVDVFYFNGDLIVISSGFFISVLFSSLISAHFSRKSIRWFLLKREIFGVSLSSISIFACVYPFNISNYASLLLTITVGALSCLSVGILTNTFNSRVMLTKWLLETGSKGH